ncbi:hypothetical protein EPD60_15335 [Flaviaesturariibacter flavus]|uniref:Uncharacterized protein n=1 Tax=Flaviaesturariibacter flavus TaxID=2502780 RepID=A0A4R1B724_9BACT|nr:hypothetical protein [Flaviaesturariibacter flavus]TCJ12637.1 hypothetical protein EPD60_15335 [Flaviaesturariibacter flavus]
MTKPSVNSINEAIQVTSSSLKVVHSVVHTEKAITRNIAGTPTVPAQPIYYPSSYSKDGPGGNYQGL